MQMDGREPTLIIPMPDLHPIFGHLLFLKKVAATLPQNTVMHSVMWKITREHFPGGLYYLHLWPFSGTILIVCNAYAASQVEHLSLGKPKSVIGPIDTISGGPSLLTQEGTEWKRWRKLFSKGFSAGHLLSLAPNIAEEMAVFRDLLRSKCQDNGRSKMFQMEEMTVRMTFDVIARVVMDKRLHYQIHDNPLAAALRSSIEWTSWRGQLNPFSFLSIRPLVHWRNSRAMNQYIGQEIDKRFSETRAERNDPKDVDNYSKSILSLLINDLLGEADSVDRNGRIGPEIKKAMCSQIRGFLLGGHDSSSGALTYCYLLLAKHQEAQNRMLAEHDAVFGIDPSQALAQIQADPHKLNQLPFTSAFIKETLRLFPPAGGMQQGRPGAFLVDEEGRQFPTENCGIWTVSQGIHYQERYWVEAESFLPERWLAGPEDPLYAGGPKTKGAWRPFEQGPRNCIGQTLVMLELKIALVLTAREVDVVPAYEEWDALHVENKKAIKTVNGNRAYQEEKIAAHPSDGFPVRVELRSRTV
ncbi:hypothetical protein N0V93_005972 [Gnomoniopsis smithogilvyi]|uniref:Cytochrome P450 n=1 Tax=Gnomoniopsis smithogilvyi TaxID=1191159 RepID=A0A9W9CYN0_9PEZI|nr:hypothetical protein N0V93_005972 [Gnomoniopsis smithogilvyi]